MRRHIIYPFILDIISIHITKFCVSFKVISRKDDGRDREDALTYVIIYSLLLLN